MSTSQEQSLIAKNAALENELAAKNREIEIESALEKVRSRSLAMHKSDELGDVVKEVFDKLKGLNLEIDGGVSIIIYKEGSKDLVLWSTAGADHYETMSFLLPYFDHPMISDHFYARESGKDFFAKAYSFEEKNRFWQWVLEHSDFKKMEQQEKQHVLECPAYSLTFAISKYSGILIDSRTGKLFSEKENDIIKRFARVFEQAYIRFLDLQKAEAQAREAQIEAAVERVRSRSLAMHKSDELKEVILVVLGQLQELGISMVKRSAIMLLFEEGVKDFIQLVASPEHAAPLRLATPYFDHVMMKDIWETREKGLNFSSITLTKEEKDHFFSYFYEHTAPLTPEKEKRWQFESEHYTFTYAVQKHSGIGIANFTDIPLSENENELLRRFSMVFEQSYIRFLDLQKAEAQTREAQIEAALERVRSKAMSMHQPKDLATTVNAFYHELESFSLTPKRCGVGLLNKENKMGELSTMNTTDEGISFELVGKVDFATHPLLRDIYDNWLLQKEYHPILRGNEIKNYYSTIRPQMAFPDYPDDVVQYGYFFFFSEGGVYVWTGQEMQEDELNIYRRFTSVLSLTYKRYKDLQQSEASAKAAIKQAALDRIRADIASMRTPKDLERITPLIWNELTILGVPFIRCGVFIMDEDEQLIHTFLSTPDGKAITAFNLPYTIPGNISFVIENWRNHKKYIDHWDEQTFTEFANSLVKQGALSSADQYMETLPAEGFYLHFLPFLQGMLYVGNLHQLNEEEMNIVQSVADAFATAYARYEDFNNLETAKKQVETTLSELKSAQKQLIQSEKMASMGELTAGIAHEIQNPLNFVNNFSEVSVELIDEMKADIDKGDMEEVRNISNDLTQNLQKINFHGKRADAIVKSMLQHSRSSSGKKEPTNINALADEYFRLSYHGMRAKDKSFNATMKTDFDESVGKIDVVPQDIGRVLLNLMNNAFYAVAERSNNMDAERSRSAISTSLDDHYEPTVWVSTKRVVDVPSPSGRPGGVVEIRVKDNGNGISEKIRDKIFQPFFTTKPTGEGTGLGLSLSYDMIKAHSGEITVNSKEGEGTEFVVVLPM